MKILVHSNIGGLRDYNGYINYINTQTYSHTNSASIGYDSCNFTINVNITKLLYIVNNLFGRNITCFNDNNIMCWEGFINEINLNVGGLTYNIGPLLDMANKVVARYTEYVTGVPGTTTYANDVASQKKYGVITKVLSIGSVSATNAEKIRDEYLYENSQPFANISGNISDSVGGYNITINCLGHYHLLSTVVYNNTSSGTTTITDKIKSVLAADPNTAINIVAGNFYSNTLSVNVNDNADRIATDVIRELVNLGGSTTNTRTMFVCYGRNAQYRLVDKTIKYLYKEKGTQNIITIHGKPVDKSLFRPGSFAENISVAGQLSSNIKSKKNFFIESCTYTYPNQLSISGNKYGELGQRLAKLGLGGI